MTLQTEHHLICNGCDRQQKGDHLREWFVVAWDEIDWEAGYSTLGHSYHRTRLHACSTACLMVIAERRFPAAGSRPEGRQDGGAGT